MVCSNGNSVYVEEKKRTYGLFDTTEPFIKGSYYDFSSEEFKMISCGKAVINMH